MRPGVTALRRRAIAGGAIAAADCVEGCRDKLGELPMPDCVLDMRVVPGVAEIGRGVGDVICERGGDMIERAAVGGARAATEGGREGVDVPARGVMLGRPALLGRALDRACKHER